VGVRGYAGHPRYAEVERGRWETRLLHEGQNEAPEAGVHMDGDAILQSQFADGFDIVGCAVREVGGRADQLETISV